MKIKILDEAKQSILNGFEFYESHIRATCRFPQTTHNLS